MDQIGYQPAVRILRLVFPMLLASAWAHAAPPAEARWSLGLGLSMGLTVQQGDRGSSTTSEILGPERNNADTSPTYSALELCPNVAPYTIRCPTEGDALLTSPSVTGSFEVMSPRLVESWGQPRLFAHLGAGYAFSVEETPSNEGALGPLTLPLTPAEGGSRNYNELSVDGQGSATHVEFGGLMWTAGVGIAFSVDTPWRKIRVKPSFEYLRQKFKGSGSVHRAAKQSPGPLIIQPCPPTLNICGPNVQPDPSPRFIELSASDDIMLNGIGPGLEIDTDAGRFRSIVVSVFAGASAYYFLGDLGFSAVGTNEYDETATFTWEADRWAYRIQGGLRFRWQPE